MNLWQQKCHLSDLARGRERHFRTGKRADSIDMTLFRLPVLSVTVLPNKFKTSFRRLSRRDQNAWDLRKLCTYKRDNAVWNDFRTHFQHNRVTSFVLFGVFKRTASFMLDSREEIRSLANGLSSLLIEQGLKQPKGFSLIHFFNPV